MKGKKTTWLEIEQVRALYEQGNTIGQVAEKLKTSKTVLFRFMHANGLSVRKRGTVGHLYGSANPRWKGNDASYSALHLRLYSLHGAPSHCCKCGSTNKPFYEWANLSGRYADTDDYAPMCRSCHKRFDSHRRFVTGQKTTEGWK